MDGRQLDEIPDAELVRQVIGLYARGPPVCGRSVLSALGGLPGLSRASRLHFSRLGLPASQIAALLASVEIGRRLARAAVPDRHPLLPSPESLARYLALRYAASHQEVMGAVFLDRRGRVIGEECFFRGTLTRCAVEPGPILRAALLREAASLILFHTHPSGGTEPSQEDIRFTDRLRQACRLMQVGFLDHLIVAPGGAWCSFRERARR